MKGGINMADPIIGTLVSAGGSLMGADAASDAGDQQAEAARRQAEMQMQMFQQSRQDQEPWRNRGNSAGNYLNFLMGMPGYEGANLAGFSNVAPQAQMPQAQQPQAQPPAIAPMQDTVIPFGGGGPGAGADGSKSAPMGMIDPRPQLLPASTPPPPGQIPPIGGGQPQQGNDFGSLMRRFTSQGLDDEPGYQYRLDQGQRQMDRQQAARGGFFSGRALQEGQRMAQGQASQEYGNAYNRDAAYRSALFNMLSGVAGTGQTSAGQMGAQAMQNGQNMGNAYMNQGNAQAAGTLGSAGQFQGLLNTLGGAISGRKPPTPPPPNSEDWW